MYDLSVLDILKARKLDWMPPHFVKMKLPRNFFNPREIQDWIEKKLDGRYAIVTELDIENDKLQPFTFLGFEDPKELTYYILSYSKGD